MKRLSFVPLFILLCAVPTHAQTGPCTESAITQRNPPAADDMFAYMPAYGRPVIGKPAVQTANKESFSARTNITRRWVGEHRIVSTPSGDMAYEHGTLHMGYDEGGKHNEFEAAMLTVFKAKDGVCQTVALTMQPLEEQPRR